MVETVLQSACVGLLARQLPLASKIAFTNCNDDELTVTTPELVSPIAPPPSTAVLSAAIAGPAIAHIANSATMTINMDLILLLIFSSFLVSLDRLIVNRLIPI
jgi:hypothetical protein